MVISHPGLASGAMTLSCWLSLALFTTKLRLRLHQHKVLSTASPPSPFEEPWLNKAEECRGEGKELAGVSGSECPRLMTRKSTCGSCTPGTKCFHFMAHAWHELTCMPAPRQQCVLLLAGAGLSLAVGELYPAVRVYSLQGRGAEYLSFRWMIKWVAQQEVKQLEFLPHYHGNLISGIMRY